MKTTICSILLLCAISINGQQIQFPGTNPSINTPRQNNPGTSSYNKQFETDFANAITTLTLNLNNQVPSVNPNLSASDLAYGPLTVAGALVLVMLASVGQTYDEIAKVLGLPQSDSNLSNLLGVHKPISDLINKIDTNEISSSAHSEVVSYATAIFVQQNFPIRQEFLKAIKETYNSSIISLNFRKQSNMAQDKINSWVSSHTNAKIPALFHSPPPPETSAIIASVLYFKAAWEYPFFDGNTKPKPFYKNGRNQPSDRKVDMMVNGGDFPYFNDRNSNVEIMGFPYKGKRITMYVLLPNDSNQVNLRHLEYSLTQEKIHELVRSTRPTEAVITFPKLKIISSVDLKPVLQRLNITSLFNPRQSNLALMSSGAASVGQRNSNGGHFAPIPTTYPQASTTRPVQNNYPTAGGQTDYLQSNPSYETQNYGPNNPLNGNPYFQPQYPTVGTQNYNNPSRREQNPTNEAQNKNNPNLSFGMESSYTQNPSVGTQNYRTTSVPQSVYRQTGILPPGQTNHNVNTAGLQNNVVQNSFEKETMYSPTQSTVSPNQDRLIFIRTSSDCSPNQHNSSMCTSNNQGDHSGTGTRFQSEYTNPLDELDKIRKMPDLVNPGIYADQIIHKVYIEITESGTEAAAATGISLNRSGGRVAFRLDVPFLFFIYHEESKVILFWGSVKNPTPSNES